MGSDTVCTANSCFCISSAIRLSICSCSSSLILATILPAWSRPSCISGASPAWSAAGSFSAEGSSGGSRTAICDTISSRRSIRISASSRVFSFSGSSSRSPASSRTLCIASFVFSHSACISSKLMERSGTSDSSPRTKSAVSCILTSLRIRADFCADSSDMDR